VIEVAGNSWAKGCAAGWKPDKNKLRFKKLFGTEFCLI
jgi:hypothetical protein